MKISKQLVIQTLVVIIFLSWFVHMWIANEIHAKNKDAIEQQERDQNLALIKAKEEEARNIKLKQEKDFNEHRDEILLRLRNAIKIGNEQQVLIESEDYALVPDSELQEIISMAKNNLDKRHQELVEKEQAAKNVDEVSRKQIIQVIIKNKGYTCNRIDKIWPFTLSEGWTASCDDARYRYDLENKGGNWEVTVK